MATLSQTRNVVMSTTIGRYVWWPILGIVDFVRPGQSKGLQIDTLIEGKNNTEMGALISAAKHLAKQLKK